MCPLPAEPGPHQPQGQHLPGLQPLGVPGLPFLWPQQLLALQSLHQGGVSTQGPVGMDLLHAALFPSSARLPQLDAPWPPSLVQPWALSLVFSTTGQLSVL